MQGDIISTVLLPLMLCFIMFSLGMGLTVRDFQRVLTQPRAFVIGFLCHFIILPAACFALLQGVNLPPALAVGFMIIAACPTGTTSNLLTYLARGDVALAVSFTAVASLVTIFSLPLITSFALNRFMGADQAIQLPIGLMMGQIFLIVGLPVGLGMLFRAFRPATALRAEPIATKLASVLFVLIVAGALAKNWTLFVGTFGRLAPLVLALNLSMLAVGYGLSRLARLERRQAVTVALETAVQNATLAILIGSSILKNDQMALPGVVYGVMMYAGGLVFVFVARRFLSAATREATTGVRLNPEI